MIDNKLKEFAKELNIRFATATFSKDLNLSMSIVSQYVNNKRKVSKGFIDKLEDTYDVSYSEFINQSDNQYEYEVITFDNYDAGHQQRYINDKAKHGWELVSAIQFKDTDGTPCFRFYFKRKSIF